MLNDETPASRWRPSARPLPTRIIPPTYPGHSEIRRVSTAGTFRLHNGQQFFTQALNGEMIGLEEVQDGVWNVIYYETLLGRFDERTRTIVLRGRIRNDSMKLKPGMFVRVALVTEKRQNAITVPEQAIWPIGQENFVYRVQDGKAVQTKIAITSRRPGSVEIGTGLSAGDIVVTEGQMKLKDGAPVMVLPAAPPAPSAAADAPQKKGS